MKSLYYQKNPLAMVCAGFFGRNAIPSPPLFLYGNLCLADKQARKLANENSPLKLDCVHKIMLGKRIVWPLQFIIKKISDPTYPRNSPNCFVGCLRAFFCRNALPAPTHIPF